MYTAVPAVVAGYPLLEALQACRRQAMAAEPGPGRAPFNRIAHSTRTWMHGDRDFNTPTVDLLYSNAWIDLRQGPVVLEIPARSRFFSRFFVSRFLFLNKFFNVRKFFLFFLNSCWEQFSWSNSFKCFNFSNLDKFFKTNSCY